jgi:hypothetical protein
MPKRQQQKKSCRITRLKSKQIALRKELMEKMSLIKKYADDCRNDAPIFSKEIKNYLKHEGLFGEDEIQQMRNEISFFGLMGRSIYDYLEQPTKGDKETKWLDELPYDLVKSFSLLVEKLEKWISPFRRGTVGMLGNIFVEVNDKDMEVFINAMEPFKKMWKPSSKTKDLNRDPFTKNVEHLKWSTTKREVAENFLERFLKSNGDRTLTKHYIKNENLASDYYIEITKEQGENFSGWAKYKMCEAVGWDPLYQDINTYSSQVIFGDYIRSGRITSECVQKENQKKKHRKSVGKFSIHYMKEVYPKHNIGWLMITCKYQTFKGGLPYNN